MIQKKTPNKKIPIIESNTRRLVGIRLDSPSRYTQAGVEVIYARTIDIDGYIFDAVETEYVIEQDFESDKDLDPDCPKNPVFLKALFALAVSSAIRPFNEVIRLLELRK